MTPETVVIDSDCHVVVPADLWERYLPASLVGRGPRLADDDGIVLIVDGVEVPRCDRLATTRGERLTMTADLRYASAAAQQFDAVSQLEALVAEGIDIALLFPSRALAVLGIDDADPLLANGITRAYNDWLADFAAQGDGRLMGVGIIDLHDPPAAAAEASRCINQLGFAGVMARPNPVAGRPLYHPLYEDMCAAIAELDVPICFHEGTAVRVRQIGPDRFERHGLWHVCSHPMEQQIAMVAMVLGGVVARHPRLRVGFMECGAGWLPYWMWRMDEAFDLDGSRDCPDLTVAPSAYVRRQCFVSADSDEDTAVFALRRLGGGNIVWGSDYPHPDAKFPDALGSLQRLEGMTKEDLASILRENPLQLYGPALRSRVVGVAHPSNVDRLLPEPWSSE